LGFYSGCGALAVSNALKSGIRFLSFETSREYLDRILRTEQGQRSPWVNVLAGLSAGVVESLLVVTPGEGLKTRLIEDAASKGARRFAGKGLAGLARVVVAEEGIRALWGGYDASVEQAGDKFGGEIYEFWDDAGAGREDMAIVGWPCRYHIDCGCHERGRNCVGACFLSLLMTFWLTCASSYASMPFDNVKTRIQSIGGDYKGMIDCAVKTLRSEGVGAFWRGTTPRLVRLTVRGKQNQRPESQR
jgi:solute carrier family 25 citrate transporter 1